MSGDHELTSLRDELARVDRELLQLVSRRQELVTRVGRKKMELQLPTRDFGQEKDVLGRARRIAQEVGLPSGLAEELMMLLIRSSLTAQEQDVVQARGGGSGRRVMVIGGSGKMGRWFVRFLASQGFEVEIADPAGALPGIPYREDWREGALDHDLVIVAAPLGASARILEEMATRPPRGVIFDIGSLKTPLRKGLRALAQSGARVSSVHPMFGPDAELLSGRHVIFVDLGVPEATRQARELFASTMVVQVEMDLEAHDHLIAYILGLSHALNIAFFTALAESGEAAPRLAQLSSTTFDAQLAVASMVARENPHLYFEIQALNDYGTESLSALLYAIERLRSIVRAGDEQAFAALMTKGRAYLERATEPGSD